MKYFSGFCFCDEKKLFENYLDDSDYSIAGFSLGAIKALEYTYKNICDDIDTKLSTKQSARIDKLTLLSPAYFNDKDKKFIRMQLMYFKKDKSSYIDNFISNSLYPLKSSDIDVSSYITDGDYDELEFLLNYRFEIDKLKKILENGTKVEIYLGNRDKIINYDMAKEFFDELLGFANLTIYTVCTVNNSGHLLRA
jgi:hypothetical protein